MALYKINAQFAHFFLTAYFLPKPAILFMYLVCYQKNRAIWHGLTLHKIFKKP